MSTMSPRLNRNESNEVLKGSRETFWKDMDRTLMDLEKEKEILDLNGFGEKLRRVGNITIRISIKDECSPWWRKNGWRDMGQQWVGRWTFLNGTWYRSRTGGYTKNGLNTGREQVDIYKAWTWYRSRADGYTKHGLDTGREQVDIQSMDMNGLRKTRNEEKMRWNFTSNFLILVSSVVDNESNKSSTQARIVYVRWCYDRWTFDDVITGECSMMLSPVNVWWCRRRWMFDDVITGKCSMMLSPVNVWWCHHRRMIHWT